MLKIILVALRANLVTLVLTGLLYPLAMTGISQLLFAGKANGSVIEQGGAAVGSELLGQTFSNGAYFQLRPSAAGEKGYDATASSGSNLGPTSSKLRDRVLSDIERLKKENPDAPGPVPDELVTASASGLDPHLSPQGAAWQVPRIAAARHVTPSRVSTLLDAHVEERDLGVLGEPRVNATLLNMALDKEFGRPSAPPPPPATPPPASSAPTTLAGSKPAAEAASATP